MSENSSNNVSTNTTHMIMCIEVGAEAVDGRFFVEVG